MTSSDPLLPGSGLLGARPCRRRTGRELTGDPEAAGIHIAGPGPVPRPACLALGSSGGWRLPWAAGRGPPTPACRGRPLAQLASRCPPSPSSPPRVINGLSRGPEAVVCAGGRWPSARVPCLLLSVARSQRARRSALCPFLAKGAGPGSLREGCRGGGGDAGWRGTRSPLHTSLQCEAQ